MPSILQKEKRQRHCSQQSLQFHACRPLRRQPVGRTRHEDHTIRKDRETSLELLHGWRGLLHESK